MANPQVSEMAYLAYFRALILKHVNVEVCPLPPEIPFFGALAPPKPEDPLLSAKALAALPPSPSVVDCCKLLCSTVSDSAMESAGHQRSSISTLDSCSPGAWTTPGKLFTPSLPAVDKYKPEYYRLDSLSCGRDISASVVRDERQMSAIAPKSLASSSYKELNNEEALAKDTMSVLSYCELALYGISESLQHSNTELPEETTQLCSSLHVGLCHTIALSFKASANAILKRRDSIIIEAKSVIRLPQLTGALRSATLGESFLFQDS
jgi:hypothetical protein